MPGTLAVRGHREVIKGLVDADRQTKTAVRAVLRHTGDAVKTEASSLFGKYDAKSAAGYKTVVRQRGINVEQSLRKTTGKRPDFGALQMRKALAPAAEDKQPETERAIEHALDEIANRFNRG